jgi:hypothetical protein
MARGEVDVYVRFDDALTADARAEFLRRMRSRTAADFELAERDGDPIMRFWRADEQDALIRADALIRGLCNRITIDAALVIVSLGTLAL